MSTGTKEKTGLHHKGFFVYFCLVVFRACCSSRGSPPSWSSLCCAPHYRTDCIKYRRLYTYMVLPVTRREVQCASARRSACATFLFSFLI